jgi:FkbM family methyltransferase
MRIKLAIARLIRWHELKLAWKVYSREYVLQHNLFSEKWKDFTREFDDDDVSRLMRNLDPESVSLVKLLLERYSNPFAVYPSLYPKMVFNQQELAEQEAFRHSRKNLSQKHGIPLAEIDPSPLMYQSGLIYVPEKARKSIKDSVVLDIGAFTGQASQSFLDLQPACIYPVEPSKGNYAKLNSNLQDHIKAARVTPVNCAMGDRKGSLYISDEGNSSSLSAAATGNKAQEVKVNTVDLFVQENNIARVGLIKMDVEGFEMNVMNGALKTIVRDKPVLLVSIYHTPTDFFKIKPILEDLNLGYRFRIRKTNPFWLTYDTILICYVA